MAVLIPSLALDLGTSQGYRDFLAAQAAAYLPVEAALEKVDASRLIADWRGVALAR